jgi:hypothetical protein
MRTILPFFVLLVACGGRVDGGVPAPASTTPSGSEPAPGTTTVEPSETCRGPACDEGHDIVPSRQACGTGNEAACYERTACGKTIVCTGNMGLCRELACIGFTQEVDTCPPDATCETQRVCERTILCKIEDAQCDAIPTCNEGDQQVASASECAKSGARCYTKTTCGARAYCLHVL